MPYAAVPQAVATPTSEATSGAAKAVNVSKELGTLEKGKQADFLVLSANPLDDIRNTRKINSVWIGGVRVADKK